MQGLRHIHKVDNWVRDVMKFKFTYECRWTGVPTNNIRSNLDLISSHKTLHYTYFPREAIHITVEIVKHYCNLKTRLWLCLNTHNEQALLQFRMIIFRKAPWTILPLLFTFEFLFTRIYKLKIAFDKCVMWILCITNMRAVMLQDNWRSNGWWCRRSAVVWLRRQKVKQKLRT